MQSMKNTKYTKNTQYEKYDIPGVLMNLTMIVFYTKIFSIMLFFLLNILNTSNLSHIYINDSYILSLSSFWCKL